jgi:hypothetical protein
VMCFGATNSTTQNCRSIRPIPSIHPSIQARSSFDDDDEGGWKQTKRKQPTCDRVYSCVEF